MVDYHKKNVRREPSYRLFTAFPLSTPIRLHVVSIIRELDTLLEGVRWVPPENLHVTLRFIGDCEDAMIPDLVGAMQKAGKYLPLQLAVGGIGGFPSLGSARVIWVGAQDRTDGVEKVYNVLDEEADKCGFGREGRQFTPHITVGRARKRPVEIPQEIVERFREIKMALAADEIVLFESTLTSAGAEYKRIKGIGRETTE